MRTVTAVFGSILIALGVGLYIASVNAGPASITALIPAFLGVVFLLCAAAARSESSRKHAMHVAALFALLGLGGCVPGVLKALKHLGGSEPERPLAIWGQTAMAVLCVAFLVLAIRSFVSARRARSGS